jgi:hypothetical protein
LETLPIIGEGEEIADDQILHHRPNQNKRKGRVQMPKCGIKISPSDRTENTYKILETVMKEECLEKVICNVIVAIAKFI